MCQACIDWCGKSESVKFCDTVYRHPTHPHAEYAEFLQQDVQESEYSSKLSRRRL